MIWGFVGPEGSGKTLCMTYFSLLHLVEGGNIQTFPGYKIETPQNKPLSTEIDFRKLFTDIPSFKNTIIDADEIQNFMDATMHMNVFSRLMGYVAAQRRKANLGIMYTVQDWMWLYNRFRQLTHLLTVCKDLYWSQWGKENHIGRGEVISLTTYDLKGFYTGEPWTLLSRKTLTAKEVWKWYDSYAAVDIFEGMRKYEIKKDTEIFDLRPVKERKEDIDDVGAEDISESSPLQLIQELAEQGVNPKTLANLGRRLSK